MCPRRSAGHTLAELMAVLLIMGALAALAMPSTEPSRGFRVDAAAVSVAEALRFGQDEAIRTGSYRLVRCDVALNQIIVAALDMSVTPPVAAATPVVLHPLDQRPYALPLSTTPATAGVTINSCSFSYVNGGSAITRAQVAFGADGAPVQVNGSAASDVLPLSVDGAITLASGSYQRSVSVAAVTGRVLSPAP